MTKYDKYILQPLKWEENIITHSVCLANTSIISNVFSQCIHPIELLKNKTKHRLKRPLTVF